jgi:transcriptional regulator with XRE-family HTH domain
MKTKTRQVTVVDNRPLAKRIGLRIKKARLGASLTQAQLAQGRYTSAYISALERGLAKPSMAAMSFISERLGVPVRQLIDPDLGATDRLDADMALVAGKWAEAAEAFADLAKGTTDRRSRGEALSGQAEALMRMDRPLEALPIASEAVEIFDKLRRPSDAAYATYWLAYAHAQAENSVQARQLLERVMQDVSAGLDVTPDFKFRLLNALSSVAAQEGRHREALSYLEEARGLSGDLDLRRRAAFLEGLAGSYRAVGDLEGSLRAGTQSYALYRALDAFLEEVAVANGMALTYLQLGNMKKAASLAAEARSHADRLGDVGKQAHVAETQAQIALAQGALEDANARATEAHALATESHTISAAANALVTRARVALKANDLPRATRDFETAADLLRQQGTPGQLRNVLTTWAESLNAVGDLAAANKIYHEALTLR